MAHKDLHWLLALPSDTRHKEAARIRYSGPEGVRALVAAARDPDVGLRMLAVCSLDASEGEEALEVLLEATEDPEIGIRSCAVGGLKGAKGERVVRALCRALQEPAPGARPGGPSCSLNILRPLRERRDRHAGIGAPFRRRAHALRKTHIDARYVLNNFRMRAGRPRPQKDARPQKD
jgi:hypothetical protein